MRKVKFIEKPTDKLYTFELLEDPHKGELISFGIHNCEDDYKQELTELVPEQEVGISYFLEDYSYFLIHVLTKESEETEGIYDLDLDSSGHKFRIAKLQAEIKKINELLNKDNLLKHTNILILIALVIIIGYLLTKK